jgi:HEAT repeat protein
MKDLLSALYQARRAALEAEAAVFDVDDESELVPVLSRALDETRALSDRTERSFRLQVLADLLSRVRDAAAPKLLLGVLNDPDESVRARAAMAMVRLASGRLPEVARAILDALDEGFEGPALLELPGLLLDASDEDAPPLDVLVKLLDHEDGDVAAEAACALAETGAKGVHELLESFVEDERTLSDVVEGPRTLGELVEHLLATMDLEDELDGMAEA